MWTVRRLANVYDTEMVRIEAVLRLKHLEKEQISKVFFSLFSLSLSFF